MRDHVDFIMHLHKLYDEQDAYVQDEMYTECKICTELQIGARQFNLAKAFVYPSNALPNKFNYALTRSARWPIIAKLTKRMRIRKRVFFTALGASTGPLPTVLEFVAKLFNVT